MSEKFHDFIAYLTWIPIFIMHGLVYVALFGDPFRFGNYLEFNDLLISNSLLEFILKCAWGWGVISFICWPFLGYQGIIALINGELNKYSDLYSMVMMIIIYIIIDMIVMTFAYI